MGGVYLGGCGWRLEKTYDTEWHERVTKIYGNAPQVTYFDTPVIVDRTGPVTQTIGAGPSP